MLATMTETKIEPTAPAAPRLWTPEGFTLVGWSDTQHLDNEAADENTSF